MRWRNRRNRNKSSTGKVITGLLIGSVVGATVGWLTAPAAGQETRRRLKGELKSVREKSKTAVGNVESRARELAEEVSENAGIVKESAVRRKRTTPTRS
jgi:gas vesicle protein